MFELFYFLNFQKISQIHQKTQNWVAFLVWPFLIRDLNISTVKWKYLSKKRTLYKTQRSIWGLRRKCLVWSDFIDKWLLGISRIQSTQMDSYLLIHSHIMIIVKFMPREVHVRSYESIGPYIDICYHVEICDITFTQICI